MRLVVVLALLLAPVALATHAPIGRCSAGDEIALGLFEVTGGTPGSTVYLEDRGLGGSGLWVYVETNGIWTAQLNILRTSAGVFRGDVTRHNLQHGGSSIIFPDDSEFCIDDPKVVPDTLIV